MSKRSYEAVASQCDELVKRRCENGAAPNSPKPVSINQQLAVELLETLFQFVSRDRYEHFRQPRDVVPANTSEISIRRRFDLRYVCLRWHNIVHRSARLKFSIRGLFELFDSAARANLSQRREDLTLLKSTLLDTCQTERQGVWFNLIDCIHAIAVESYHHVNDGSLLRVLDEATIYLSQPCDLSLDLIAADMDGVSSMIKDPDANFSRLFPTLTLRDLSLDFPTDWWAVDEDDDFDAQFEHVKRCTMYLLNVGRQSLNSLSIPLTALDVMPEDWTCETMNTLRVELDPMDINYYSVPPLSEDEEASEIAKQARIPRMFPQLESLSLRTDKWPHIDCTVLGQMEHLKTLEVYSWSLWSHRPRQWSLCALPKIESLELSWQEDALPLRLNEFVPNVKQLTLGLRHKSACIGLLAQMTGDFQRLSDLSLKPDPHSRRDELPPAADVVALFAGLHQLPALTSLSFELQRGENADWCRPGDFSLLQVLPRSLRACSFSYCLLPAPMIGSPDEVKFVFDPNVANAEEAIYKSWFQNAVLRLSDLPSLERCYCRIRAPSFHAAVSLAAKWSKSSSAAIADLGLANVINISCSTDAYLSIEPGHRYSSYDTLKFRFTLASRPDLANKEFSTRMFTFELEHPDVLHYRNVGF